MQPFRNWWLVSFLMLAISVMIVIATGLPQRFFSADKPSGSIQPDILLSKNVQKTLAYPIVFTSRTESNALEARAPESDGLTYPGTIPWSSREGRLRLLDKNGKVSELTWGKILPCGSTLIDVMSPSVGMDGDCVYFSGRKDLPDAGRWRIFRLDLANGRIEQLTGTEMDPGCAELPPMRRMANGDRIPDKPRRSIDFDDVDPVGLGPDGFAFASSRLPDLGRDHSRRATQIWTWKNGDPGPRAISANRNNDRWPFQTTSDQLIFSLWSRNREAITADLSDIKPVSLGGDFATAPTDHWMTAFSSPNGTLFGYALKTLEATWRTRPLFNGRMAFMTDDPENSGNYRLAQADWGYIKMAPSAAPPAQTLEDSGMASLDFGPCIDRNGNHLSAGCPSPFPENGVLFSGEIMNGKQKNHALYWVDDNWSGIKPVPDVLFDDPEFHDSEPVAVYKRSIVLRDNHLVEPASGRKPPASIRLVDKTDYIGPAGYIENLAILLAIRNPIPWSDISKAERIDPRIKPQVPPPPNVRSIAFYGARRDSFADPDITRIKGEWRKVVEIPIKPPDGDLLSWVPSIPGETTVLAGLDKTGKIAKWEGGVGQVKRTFFAYAGDHYSQVRKNGYHYCNGCHTGHTFHAAEVREKLR